jgi:hypothetical protein
MKNQISNRKSKIIHLIAACVILAALGPPAAELSRASNGRGGPPQPINGTFTISGTCAFDVQVTITGRESVINLPGGRFIVTGPNFTGTFTNLSDPTKSVTLNLQGAAHISFDQNGNQIFTLTGRNLAFEPGLLLLIGTFTYVFDPNGNVISGPTGNGQMTDICGLIN